MTRIQADITIIIGHIFHVTNEKLPKSQNIICGSWLFVSAKYFAIPTKEVKNAPTTIPDTINPKIDSFPFLLDIESAKKTANIPNVNEERISK